MSFQEKSTALMLAILVVVYGWYFVVIVSMAQSSPIEEISYQPLMLVTMAALAVLAVVGHISLAVVPPYDGDRADARDRLVDLKGSASEVSSWEPGRLQVSFLLWRRWTGFGSRTSSSQAWCCPRW